MKAVFLFFCLALAAANADDDHHSKDADHDFLVRQKNVFHLLYHVHQPNIHEDQVKFGKEWHLEENIDKYDDPQVVKNFLNVYKTEGYLRKGGIFSISDEQQLREMEHLFELFYHAKDWDTFYKTACWAREHINEQMFVYAFSVAVLHRKDCEGVILPPPYETFPYYFISHEYINQAYTTKMLGRPMEGLQFEDKTVLLKTNYTGWYVRWNDEQKLTYFTEDVGLNTYYYHYHLDYPYWMDGEKYHIKKDRRGEIFYYVHQQLLARYYLERLSNGMGEIPYFSWNMPVEEGYYPSLQYHNGLEFPSRPNEFDFHQHDLLYHLVEVEAYEKRIMDAVDQGYFIDSEGKHIPLTKYEHIDYLGGLVEHNEDVDHKQYYGNVLNIAKMLLGNSIKPRNWHSLIPSAMEHYQTALRDPAYYQLLKRYIAVFMRFQEHLGPYKKEELMCPGVKIENVEVEKLITYFDNFDVDITNVVYQNEEESKKQEDNMYFKARQPRLNHKPFTVTTNLVSEKATKVVVKFFLGPKFNGKGHTITLEENRHNFVELDQFVYDLKAGKNTIQRNSNDFGMAVRDWTSARTLYYDVSQALEGKSKFPLDMTEAHNGYPRRLLLPRGWFGGMPAYLYVIVYPYEPPTTAWGTGFDEVISSGVGSGARNLDNKPFGYPFNLPVKEMNFMLPNMHFEDVFIYHKRDESAKNRAYVDYPHP